MAFLIATSVNPLFLFENTRAAKEEKSYNNVRKVL